MPVIVLEKETTWKAQTCTVCEDNIKIGPRGIGCEGVDWINMPYDRVQGQALVDVVMNLWVP